MGGLIHGRLHWKYQEVPLELKGSWHNTLLEQVLETIKNENKKKLHKRTEAYAIFQIRSYDFNFVNESPKFMQLFQFEASIHLYYSFSLF